MSDTKIQAQEWTDVPMKGSGANLRRFAVPGGWIYKIVGENVMEFVPCPPEEWGRLVAIIAGEEPQPIVTPSYRSLVPESERETDRYAAVEKLLVENGVVVQGEHSRRLTADIIDAVDMAETRARVARGSL